MTWFRLQFLHLQRMRPTRSRRTWCSSDEYPRFASAMTLRSSWNMCLISSENSDACVCLCMLVLVYVECIYAFCKSICAIFLFTVAVSDFQVLLESLSSAGSSAVCRPCCSQYSCLLFRHRSLRCTTTIIIEVYYDNHQRLRTRLALRNTTTRAWQWLVLANSYP